MAELKEKHEGNGAGNFHPVHIKLHCNICQPKELVGRDVPTSVLECARLEWVDLKAVIVGGGGAIVLQHLGWYLHIKSLWETGSNRNGR